MDNEALTIGTFYMLKYRGDVNLLKSLVGGIDIHGSWSGIKRQFTYRASTGAVLNWWPTTGTFTVQGPEMAALAFEEALLDAMGSNGKTRRQFRPHTGIIDDADYVVIDSHPRGLTQPGKPTSLRLPSAGPGA